MITSNFSLLEFYSRHDPTSCKSTLTNTIERFFLMKLEGCLHSLQLSLSLSHHSHKFNFPADYFLAIKTHAHNDTYLEPRVWVEEKKIVISMAKFQYKLNHYQIESETQLEGLI